MWQKHIYLLIYYSFPTATPLSVYVYVHFLSIESEFPETVSDGLFPRLPTCLWPVGLHKSHVDLLTIIKNIGGSDHILQQDASSSPLCLS